LDGGTVAELTELEKQLKRKKRDIQFGAKSRMPEVSRKRAPGRESGQYRYQSQPRRRSKGSKSLIERFTFIR
jgi:hypothetical protein